MDESDRLTITRNISRLVSLTNLDLLIPKLLERGVFSPTMIEKYMRIGPEQQRKTELYLDIQRRGPDAFQNLVESFLEIGNSDLALLLQPNRDVQSVMQTVGSISQTSTNENGNHSTVPCQLNYYPNSQRSHFREFAHAYPNCAINTNTRPLKVAVKLATSRYDSDLPKGNLKIYHMGSRPKGYFLLINNIEFTNDIEERRGAEVDEESMTQLFEGLGYEVMKHRNLPLTEMTRIIKEFSQMEGHKEVHSCVVSILSHGNSRSQGGDTEIIAADGNTLSTQWVLENFNDYHCPHLSNRPKIFIFQVCRGSFKDYGVILGRRTSTVQSDGYPLTKRRSYSDMLIAYSTIPGYVSHRDIYNGTWYIQSLCKIFMEHACDTEIKDLLTMVDNEMRRFISDFDTMQTSSYESWGFQKFYFNPGIYDDQIPFPGLSGGQGEGDS